MYEHASRAHVFVFLRYRVSIEINRRLILRRQLRRLVCGIGAQRCLDVDTTLRFRRRANGMDRKRHRHALNKTDAEERV